MVCDSGFGIFKENCYWIFEDFFWLEWDELKEGYGIGLVLCCWVVLFYYGKIWVDFSFNYGSCFYFILFIYW